MNGRVMHMQLHQQRAAFIQSAAKSNNFENGKYMQYEFLSRLQLFSQS